MKGPNQVKVVIGGEVYELNSEESPQHIQAIATYVDSKMKEMYKQKSKTYINAKLRSLFISLNIADDLFKEKAKNHKLQEEVLELSETLKEYMEENKELLKINEELIRELDGQTRNKK